MSSLTWTASNGAEIEITAEADEDGAILTAKIDGKVVARREILDRVTPVVVNGQTVVAAIGKVGLTAERAEAVRAMLAAAKAECGDLADLRSRRVELVSALSSIRRESDYAARRRITTASATGIDKGSRSLSTRERAAADALDAFDVAHPEILAEIQAERANRYVD